MEAKIFEALMMLSFGASWPMQIWKTVRVKNPTGKSFIFEFLILFGYLSGITMKCVAGKLDIVIVLYIINTLMVAADLLLSLYYKKKMEKV